MDFRKTFDTIPDDFDKYRPRYCKELFDKLISTCDLRPDKKVLEIGPGTGQATERIKRMAEISPFALTTVSCETVIFYSSLLRTNAKPRKLKLSRFCISRNDFGDRLRLHCD